MSLASQKGALTSSASAKKIRAQKQSAAKQKVVMTPDLPRLRIMNSQNRTLSEPQPRVQQDKGKAPLYPSRSPSPPQSPPLQQELCDGCEMYTFKSGKRCHTGKFAWLRGLTILEYAISATLATIPYADIIGISGEAISGYCEEITRSLHRTLEDPNYKKSALILVGWGRKALSASKAASILYDSNRWNCFIFPCGSVSDEMKEEFAKLPQGSVVTAEELQGLSTLDIIIDAISENAASEPPLWCDEALDAAKWLESTVQESPATNVLSIDIASFVNYDDGKLLKDNQDRVLTVPPSTHVICLGCLPWGLKPWRAHPENVIVCDIGITSKVWNEVGNLYSGKFVPCASLRTPVRIVPKPLGKPPFVALLPEHLPHFPSQCEYKDPIRHQKAETPRQFRTATGQQQPQHDPRTHLPQHPPSPDPPSPDYHSLDPYIQQHELFSSSINRPVVELAAPSSYRPMVSSQPIHQPSHLYPFILNRVAQSNSSRPFLWRP